MITITLISLVLISSPTTYAQDTGSFSTTAPPRGQVVGNYITINATVFLSNNYRLFEAALNQKVEIVINFNFTTPPTQNYRIVIRTYLSKVRAIELPPNVTYTYGFWGYPPIGTLTFNFPGNFSLGTVKLEGYIPGSSILFRNALRVPTPLNISSPVGYVSSFKLSLIPPPSSRILKIYSRFYPDLSVERTKLNGYDQLVVSKIYPGVPFLVLYEHELWTPGMIIILLIAIFTIIVLPYVTSFLKKNKIHHGFKTIVNQNQRLNKKIRRRLLKVNASKLLAAYAMFAIFMVSLSLMVGPDPRLKVYVLSSTPTISRDISDLVENKLGGVAITVFDEMSEFNTLTNLRVFSAVIVADFHPPNRKILEDSIYPGLHNLPHYYDSIIVLKPYVEESLLEDLQKRYSDRTLVVEDFASVEKALLEIPERNNLLGLKVEPTLFLNVAVFLGICSFILVFLGLAFLSSVLIESGKKPTVAGLFEAVTYPVFVFVFTEVVYIICGVLLAAPLGLHAGGSKVTTIGMLGFGGGSRPRMLAGFLGFMFGALISLKEGVKLSRIGLVAFLVILLFLVVDPLTGGLMFYEFILLYAATPYAFETAERTMFYVKDFLSSFGAALGGWASPTLVISTGIILYYAGAVPFFLFPKMRRSTATLMLLFCAFSVASGGIRVSNMRPWGALMSIFPGVITSFVAILVWYGLNFVEEFIKEKLEKGGFV